MPRSWTNGAPPRRPHWSRRREKAVPHPDTKRLTDVERELRRKEKALTNAAALLVLKNEVERYFADADDTTTSTRDR